MSTTDAAVATVERVFPVVPFDAARQLTADRQRPRSCSRFVVDVRTSPTPCSTPSPSRHLCRAEDTAEAGTPRTSVVRAFTTQSPHTVGR
ncbi:hypothetical protein [Streptomyces sp. Y2F8-2]|uniref:hypothetical protein n=1 Tax=Streptomyces sp. Y2F8-2 TaxID=2759675 RepID=UPI001907C280|nr:hypothetical protein [Streptomyces sp. Y2F8-2]